MVERKDPDNIFIIGGSPEEMMRYLETDFWIRTGMCPNGHGFMVPTTEFVGQKCETCGFCCNTPMELKPQ